MWHGHFRQFPHGDCHTHFLLAQICELLAAFMGVKKRPEGSPAEKPDPNAIRYTDYAFWLTDSFFDVKREWTEADEIRVMANRVLGTIGKRSKK